MYPSHHNLTTMILFAALGCGPAQIGTGPGTGTEAGTDTTGADTTTSSEPSDTETSNEASTTVEFVPSEDIHSHQWECDSFAQDCPEGEKCMPYASSGGSLDSSKCVPIMGEQQPGEPCTYGGTLAATDDCDGSGMCWSVNEEGVGVCRAFCTGTGDDPECPSGSHCLFGGDGVLFLCIPYCHPLEQDCVDGQACYWTGSQFHCAWSLEDLPAGAPCGFINDCAAGSICMNPEVLPDCEGTGCCTPFCDLELGDAQCDSAPGTSCLPFFEENMAPPGYELVGVCVLP
jgi:hypothetical protein